MGKVTLFSKAEHLDVSVDDNDFDMEKLWAYLTIQQMQEKKENLEGDDTVSAQLFMKIFLNGWRCSFFTSYYSLFFNVRWDRRKIAYVGKNINKLLSDTFL